MVEAISSLKCLGLNWDLLNMNLAYIFFYLSSSIEFRVGFGNRFFVLNIFGFVDKMKFIVWELCYKIWWLVWSYWQTNKLVERHEYAFRVAYSDDFCYQLIHTFTKSITPIPLKNEPFILNFNFYKKHIRYIKLKLPQYKEKLFLSINSPFENIYKLIPLNYPQIYFLNLS